MSKPNNWSVSEFEVDPIPGKTRFHDFELHPQLMRAIHSLNYQYCSPIQAQSLPYSLAGHDVLGKAQTGTGKTAAFMISVVQELLLNPIEDERFAGEARVLIVAPTRELVLQIAEEAKSLSQFTDLTVHTLVGGMDYGKQQDKLRGVLIDILVATPGRMLDFCEKGDVHLDQVEILVIDEADRMLDMGFIPQMRRIVGKTPKKTSRQTMMFSATFSEDVLRLADQWMVDPTKIEIEAESIANKTVEQHIYLAASEEKYLMLFNLLQDPKIDTLIVFANRRDECRVLHETLKSHGIKAGILSGEVQQNRRVKTLDDFKKGRIQVLVATDVAGRGIHIDDVSHVVNYTLPEEPEDYVHRIGRTGRAGADGVSISFACEDDAFRIPAIQALLGTEIECEQAPEALLAPMPEEMKLPKFGKVHHRPPQRGRPGSTRHHRR